MSRQVRRDPLTGTEVVLSEERSVARRLPVEHPSPGPCPFCPGREGSTRPTIEQLGEPWSARAFANRRPALVVEEGLDAGQQGPYAWTSGVGAHEVLVESRGHAPLHEQPVQVTEAALELAVRRLRDLRGDGRLRTLLWIRNHGAAAGASQGHPHAQIVGLPIVPDRIQAIVVNSGRWRSDHPTELLEAVIAAERLRRARLVADDGVVVAFCPWAPRHPFEVWLCPAEPGGAHLADSTDRQLSHLALQLHRMVGSLQRALGPVAYNVVALGAPSGVDPRGIGWHLRVTPRVVIEGGVEVGSGVAMHGVFPEVSAKALRGALERDQPPVP